MAVSSYLDIRAIEQVPLRERGLAANTYAALQHCALANAEAPALSFVLDARRHQRTHDWSYAELFADITSRKPCRRIRRWHWSQPWAVRTRMPARYRSPMCS